MTEKAQWKQFKEKGIQNRIGKNAHKKSPHNLWKNIRKINLIEGKLVRKCALPRIEIFILLIRFLK